MSRSHWRRTAISALVLVALLAAVGLWDWTRGSTETPSVLDEVRTSVDAPVSAPTDASAGMRQPVSTAKGEGEQLSSKKGKRERSVPEKPFSPEDSKARSERLLGWSISPSYLNDVKLMQLIAALAERSEDSGWIRDDSRLIGDIATELVESKKKLRKTNSAFAQRLTDIALAAQKSKNLGRYLRPSKTEGSYSVSISSATWNGKLYIPTSSDSKLKGLAARKPQILDGFLQRIEEILSARRKKH